MTIVVGGYIVSYPLGGMTWHHLNYLLGLQELGHEVWFVEDSGMVGPPYNPSNWTCEPDPTYGIEYLKRTFARYGFPPERFCYYSEALDHYFGLSKQELHDVLRRADVMICVSGVTPLRPDRPRPKKCVVIDTDPVFTQLKMEQDPALLEYYRQFDMVATFGRLIGTVACPLPTHGLDWQPTNQPIALQHWPVAPSDWRAFTTIGKWEHSSERHVSFRGQKYLSSKGPEWMKLLDLPGESPWDLRLAMSAMPTDVRETFISRGWQIQDAERVTMSCESFADFIRESAGALTVAKGIYAGLPSGWFSDRESAYLASGKPVVTQSSGFEQWLPTGQGLFAFSTMEEASVALYEIASDYEGQCRAARAVAEQYFSAGIVLDELLGRVV